MSMVSLPNSDCWDRKPGMPAGGDRVRLTARHRVRSMARSLWRRPRRALGQYFRLWNLDRCEP